MSDLPYQCICGARYPRRGLALLCCSERLIKRQVRCDGGQTPDTQDESVESPTCEFPTCNREGVSKAYKGWLCWKHESPGVSQDAE